MPRASKNPLSGLAKAARDQLRRAEQLGKALDTRIKIKKDVAPEWTPSEDDRRDFAAITQTLQHAGNALIRGLEANKKDLGGLTEEQLQAQFRAEILKMAAEMSDEDWNTMVDARRKAGRLP